MKDDRALQILKSTAGGRAGWLALLAMTGASPAATKADPYAPSPQLERCMNSGDAAKGITVGMMDCYGGEIDRQDVRLNSVYRTLIARLSPAQQEKLRVEERAWIKQRDRICRGRIAGETGSMSGLIYSECALDQTIRRRVALERRP
jgi:uncharacterized protein YecT (DUF1311 family)